MTEIISRAETAVQRSKDLLAHYISIRDSGRSGQVPIFRMIGKQKKEVEKHERRLQALRFPKLSRIEEIKIILAALDDEGLRETYQAELRGLR